MAIERPKTRAPGILGPQRELVEVLVQNMNDRGIATVFLEAPANPNRVGRILDRRARYQAELEQFAQRIGATYWDFNPELDFAASDFQDGIHLASKAAKVKFTQTLSRRLTDLLQGLGEQASSGETG